MAPDLKATKETDGSPVLNNNGQVIGVIVPYGSYACVFQRACDIA